MPRTLTVTAIIAAYNEEDVIGPVLEDLVGQGVRVHLLDHGSTDATVAEAERFRGRGLLSIERLDGETFSLARIIRRKEVLAAELDTDWLVNADADEFRESPWPGVGFFDALQEVDRMGFNAVDFAVLNFPPVHDAFRKGDDPRDAFRYCEPGAGFDRLQVRCWKRQPGPLDLVSTAGHEARFPGRRVFPLRFLLRHYPIRSQAHGERKVFRERLPRFAGDERARGWHVQYDGLKEGASFLRESSSLTPYDPWTTRLDLALRHRGVEALEEDLTRRQAQLTAAGEELAHSREEAGAARGELLGNREALASARELTATLEGELHTSRAALQLLEGRLEAVRSERDASFLAQARLSAERDEGQRLVGELSQRDAALRVLEERLEAVRSERDASLREQQRLSTEKGEREREAGRRSLEAERLWNELSQRGADLSTLRQELAATAEAGQRRLASVQYRLEAVLNSRVWRWTAPVRALIDALSRR